MDGRAVPIILDVDTGIDDALALALAVASPRVDLVTVTTLAGNVDVERTTTNTLAVLDWLGASSVPVHRGASRPLVRPHQDAAFVHGTDGLGNAELPISDRALGPTRGPAEIVRLANLRPGAMTLICVGPLTNLAIALNVEPRLPDLIDRVIVMGGAFSVPGNVTTAAEFNIYVDPEAAAQVFAAPFKQLIAIGLDVTQQVVLPRSMWEATTGATEAAPTLVSRICRRSFVERDLDAVQLHDPLALAVALDPMLVGCIPAQVSVAIEGEERGRTRVVGPGSVAVASTVDAERFMRLFTEALALPGV